MQLVRERSFLAWVWVPAFAASQFVAFVVALALDPAGFDACDLTASSGPRLVQAGVAGVAIAGSVALAFWRLRGWRLLAALVMTGLATLLWVWLLDDSTQSCGTPVRMASSSTSWTADTP